MQRSLVVALATVVLSTSASAEHLSLDCVAQFPKIMGEHLKPVEFHLEIDERRIEDSRLDIMDRHKFYLHVTPEKILWGYQMPGRDDELWDYEIRRSDGGYSSIITHRDRVRERYQSGYCRKGESNRRAF
jgi:hypothetical protein